MSYTDPDVNSPNDKHFKWYSSIHAKVWERITFEDQLPPSIEALELHWMKTLWIIDYWSQACQSQLSLLPLEWFGWNVWKGGEVSVEWDSEENIRHVHHTVSNLTHGCSCKTGCSTRHCKCVRAGPLDVPAPTVKHFNWHTRWCILILTIV